MSGIGDELSPAFNVTGEPPSYGAGFELLCCAGGGMPGNAERWISAAELIYELTGEPGRVVRNTITFELEGENIELNLLDGAFSITGKSRGRPATGRKGLELLMKWKGYDFDGAVEYIVTNYSEQQAIMMVKDFSTMKARELSRRGDQVG